MKKERSKEKEAKRKKRIKKLSKKRKEAKETLFLCSLSPKQINRIFPFKDSI